MHLGIELGQNVPVIDAGLLEISDGSLLHDVPHLKPLDCLVLRAALGAVGASDVLDVPAAVLVAAAVAALEGHGGGGFELRGLLVLLLTAAGAGVRGGGSEEIGRAHV